MLQKLENAYLAILRFVVLAVAGLLLVCVGLFGVNALKLMKEAPAMVGATPKVTSEEVVAAVTSKAVPVVPEGQGKTVARLEDQADPLAAHYDRAVNAIVKFGNKVSGITLSVNHESMVQVLKNRTKEVREAGHEEVFVKGLADVLEKALATPAVIKAASSESPFDVVDRIINHYVERFNAQINETNAKNADAHQQFQAEKEEGLQSLYYAAGGFGAFLLIVFLSIIIRIERNLRNLERLPAKQATEDRHQVPLVEPAQ